MPIIYRKTAKGLSEVETREHRLPPRQRATLILVDGRRDADELGAMIPQQAEEIIAALLAQGFIEAVGVSASSPPRGRVAAAPAPAPVAAPVADAGFVKARGAAVRNVNDLLGPMGESVAIKMERARDADELRPLLQLAAQLIASARGRSAAEDFLQRHGS